MPIKFNEVTWYSKLGALILFIIVIPALAFYIGMQYEATNEVTKGISNTMASNLPINADKNTAGLTTSVLNGTYTIDNEQVTFTNGKSEALVAPGSASMVETRIFGNPTMADIDGDGKSDAVFFIAQETGGTGIFFYAAAALNVDGSYKPLNTIFLGDRIAPQNVNVSNGVISFNYADRKKGDAMTEQHSVGVSKYFIVKNGELIEK